MSTSDTAVSPPRLAIATTSGSSGKTTSTITVAAILAERRLRVLVVDTDFQMDASRWLGTAEKDIAGRATLLDVLRDRSTIRDAIGPSALAGVDLLPAHPDLDQVRTILAGQMNLEQRLRRALDDVEADYDAILIDCRAGKELPTLAAIVAADAVIGATWAGAKELRNTLSLEEYVQQIADGYERPLQLVGILPCKVPSSGLIYQEALASVRDVFGDLVLPAVRQTRSVTEAHAEQVPVTARARWRAVADDYRAVVDELVSRGALPAGTEVRA